MLSGTYLKRNPTISSGSTLLYFEQELINILKQYAFDIIHIEGLHMSLYLDTIRKHSKAKIVLRAHNIEYLIWKRLYENEANPLKKWYLRTLTEKLKRFELDVLNKFDALVPITGQDAETLRELGCILPLHVSPTGPYFTLARWTGCLISRRFPGLQRISGPLWRKKCLKPASVLPGGICLTGY
jgi:hypothetical protein